MKSFITLFIPKNCIEKLFFLLWHEMNAYENSIINRKHGFAFIETVGHWMDLLILICHEPHCGMQTLAFVVEYKLQFM